MFSSEICEIFEKTFFTEHLRLLLLYILAQRCIQNPKPLTIFTKSFIVDVCQGSEFASVAILKYFRELQENTNYITVQK